ncbi:FKBP12-associated protein 1-like protein [Smittium mucronatum]|uniref:FKBP12-associated protein 1-like protein n=1 Tax=Smittium mucronatum TaxID=133383 RepID=A0A1R0H5J8_9FUNG|nr:FKBP12-associated protein 1-like protein [Smittium mucronatum]
MRTGSSQPIPLVDCISEILISQEKEPLDFDASKSTEAKSKPKNPHNGSGKINNSQNSQNPSTLPESINAASQNSAIKKNHGKKKIRNKKNNIQPESGSKETINSSNIDQSGSTSTKIPTSSPKKDKHKQRSVKNFILDKNDKNSKKGALRFSNKQKNPNDLVGIENEPRERINLVETQVNKSREGHLKWLFDRQKNSKNNGNKILQNSFSSTLSESVYNYDKKQEDSPNNHDTNRNKNHRSRNRSNKLNNFDSLIMSKSIEANLMNRSYECLICYEIVEKKDFVWSCDECYSIMHLHCVTQWAESSLTSELSGSNVEKKWRCPGCQKKRINIPSSGHCFCQKHTEPINHQFRGKIPHSCNEVCGKVLNCSSHTCSDTCHPGKCPDCTVSESVKECFCGKLISVVKCDGKFHSQNLVSCGHICNKLLKCGSHRCKNICHSGDCAPCDEVSLQSCYCGKKSEYKSIHDIKPHKGWSVKDSNLAVISGSFSCGDPCPVPYACNIHSCSKKCHSHDLNIIDEIPVLEACPYDPSSMANCPCGKSLLSDLEIIRNSCADPIPLCGSICGKVLACGHKCNQNCHNGPCPPCEESINFLCKCGKVELSSKCGAPKVDMQDRSCTNICKQMLNCKRHQCEEICCIASNPNFRVKKPASKPKSQKNKKNKKVNLNNGVFDSPTPTDHIEIFVPQSIKELHHCKKVCGRTLSCGVHECEDLCHAGQCRPCQYTSDCSISCPCGMTRLGPPLLCGSALPKCHFPCNKARECGHFDSTYHDCHPEGTSCPPCPFYVSKVCQCDKKILMSNIPCSRVNVFCGQICGKLLDCGSHYCELTCHPSNVKCLSLAGGKCKSLCLKPRKCGHECVEVCHAPSRCPEGTKCLKIVVVTCECGNLSNQITCSDRTVMRSLGNEFLECTELCKMVIRNKKVAEALDVEYKSNILTLDYVKVEYDPRLLDFGIKNRKFLADVEMAAATFAADNKRWNHWFAPMRRESRLFLHLLAPYYNCTSASVDSEPKRNVCWTKRKLSCDLPIFPLSEIVFPSKESKSFIENGRKGLKVSEENGQILVPVTVDVFKALKEMDNNQNELLY